MTDKRIIINGCDVSGCKFYNADDETCRELNGKYTIVDDCNFAKCEYFNCYYKQLKRKEQECEILASQLDFEVQKKECLEQECEELKKKLKPKLKNAHCAYFEGQTGLCKAKEFLRCNPVGCRLYTIDELSTIVELQQQLNQLKRAEQKLEKIKEIINTHKQNRCKACSEFDNCLGHPYCDEVILKIIEE